MLYFLLVSLKVHISVLNVFRYITFRAMCAFIVAFVTTLAGMPRYVHWLKDRGVKGQPIRDDGPKDHIGKQGTPTMGGLVVVGSIIITSLLLCDLTNIYVWLTLVLTAVFCATFLPASLPFGVTHHHFF